MGVAATALFMRYGLGPEMPIYLCFIGCLLVVTFVDLEHQIIPDIVSLPGIVLGFIFSFWLPELSWMDSIVGVLTGGGILYMVAWLYYVIAHREGMGGGDIKLLAMIGAFLGWKSIPLVIFLSAAVGAATGLTLMVVSRGGRHSAIPYGPFLAGAAVIALFWGSELIRWYSGFLAGV